MAGIFFVWILWGLFSVTFKHRLEFVCEMNSGDQRWVNVNINKRPKPQGAAKRRENSSTSRSISVQCGCWWDRCEWDRCQCVRVFVFVVGFTFFNVPASVHPPAFCGLALWQGCVEGEDLGMTRAAERSGECCGLHSSSLRIVCRMLSKKMTTCQSRKADVDMVAATQHTPALPLALFPSLSSFLQGDIQSVRPRLDLSELFLHQTTQRTKSHCHRYFYEAKNYTVKNK